MKNVVKPLSIFVSVMLVAAVVVGAEAQCGEYVETNASVNPGVIQLGENTEVTIALTGNGTPEISFPLDVVLVMDCSGSMNRYGTIITNLSDVTLTTSYQKVGEFTITATEDVEVMLQTLPGRGYGADVYYSPYDIYWSYLKEKATGAEQPEKSGYSVVRWNNLQPGTYEVYAKLFWYYSGYTQPQRAFCVELQPTRREGAKSAANEFVDLLKDDDRVAVVKFHSNNWVYSDYCKVICNLWDGKSAAKNTINGLPASGGTPMGEGLDRALDHLIENGRDGAVKAIILLTDGWWNMGCSPIDQAQRAANHGIPIYVIGWGGVNYDELTQIAEITGGRCYFPATVEDLEEIYEGLAKELSNITAKNVTLRVELSDAVEYAGNASVEPGEINGKILTWDLGEISMNQTKSISFEVRPGVSGEVKLNTDNSSITYEDVYGHLHEVQLPVLSVRVTEPPVAVATANPDETFTYSDIVFDASASYDPDNISHIVSYNWTISPAEFEILEGTLNSSNLKVWFTNGTNDGKPYSITLTVTDNYGVSNSTSVEVRVKNRAPNASIIGPDVTSEGVTVEFSANASDTDGDVVNYNWSFGNGHYGVGETVTHEYTAPGIYNVTLTVADDDGATATATHELTVTKPVAVIGVSSEEVKTYESVTLDGNGSYGYPEGEIASYNWTISPAEFEILEGTPNSSNLKVWFTNGTNEGKPYSITLTVTDNYGASNSTSVEVRVKNKNLPPVASFSVSNETPETNQRVEFDASSSYDHDGSIVAYRWDFDGDGVWDIEGNVVTITHSYNKSGNYTVKLEVEDDVGATDWTTKEINVSVAGAGKRISGNVTWNGKHIIEGLQNTTIIGNAQHINATAQEIKNTRNSTVNVTVELRVDGLLLNSTTESLEPHEQKDITVSATWVPMSSGIHYVSLHAYDGLYWVGPTNDPGAKVKVLIEKVKVKS